jgi:hypothetical protein
MVFSMGRSWLPLDPKKWESLCFHCFPAATLWFLEKTLNVTRTG